MSNDRLAKLREHVNKTQLERESREKSSVSYYPFFKMDFGQQAIIRFLPDKNPQNPEGFMIRNATHKLTVNGISRTVPCMHNYGHKQCPICDISKEFYKREGKGSVNGKKYWRQVQYLARVVVVQDPLPVEAGKESHEGQIRVVGLTDQLYQKILSALTNTADPLDAMPDDLEEGINFIIAKEKQGDYASYNNSGFARRSTPVPINIDQDVDLVDLRTLLRAEPDMKEIEALLRADLTGEPYDDGSSAYRRASTGLSSIIKDKASTVVENNTQQNSVSSVTTSTESTSSSDDDEFMVQLRERAEKRKRQAAG